MIWAIGDNKRIKAKPEINGFCPLCNETLIPKCGDIKIWHWAHINNSKCDSWKEPETEWHRKWKEEFPKENQEVIIEKSGVKHIADIQNKKNKVIEFQNSPISSRDIEKRENFYGNMVWMINGNTIGKNIDIRFKKEGIITFRWKHPPKSWWNSKKPLFIDLTYQIKKYENILQKIIKGKRFFEGTTSSFENEETGKTYFYSEGAFDITESKKEKSLLTLKHLKEKPIFQIKKIYKNIPCGGWGKLIDKEEFLK